MRVTLHLLAFSAWVAATAIGLSAPSLQAQPLTPAVLGNGDPAIGAIGLRGTWPAS